MSKPPPPPINPEDPLTLAQNITAISSCLKKLLKSGLKRQAIVILVSEDTGVTRTNINAVFNSLEDLSKKYCNT